MAWFFIENLALHIKSTDAVLKNYILVADGIELPGFGKNGWTNVTTSNNSISGSVSPIISYLNLSFLLLFTFLHPWVQ